MNKSMVKSLVFLALCSGFVQNVLAQSNSFPQNSTCICDSQDKYDPKPKMPAGLFKGRCINSCQQRSVTLLSSNPNYLTIANFSHNNKFWIAQIPLQGIDTVIYQTEEFEFLQSCPACHSQLRFRFKPDQPVILTPQIGGNYEVKLTDIVYSIEATGVPGMNFDPFTAILDFYGLSYRFVSLQDRAERMIKIDNHTVKQLKLNLDQTDRAKLLNQAVLQSNQFGMKQMYSLYNRNCTTELFQLLDRSVSKKIPGQTNVFINIPTGSFISDLIRQAQFDLAKYLANTNSEDLKKINQLLKQVKQPKDALQERGLLDLNSELPTLNQELES